MDIGTLREHYLGIALHAVVYHQTSSREEVDEVVTRVHGIGY